MSGCPGWWVDYGEWGRAGPRGLDQRVSEPGECGWLGVCRGLECWPRSRAGLNVSRKE